jgi:hypothetical protein
MQVPDEALLTKTRVTGGRRIKKPGGRTPGFAVLLRSGKEEETDLNSSPIHTAWIAKGSLG